MMRHYECTKGIKKAVNKVKLRLKIHLNNIVGFPKRGSLRYI